MTKLEHKRNYALVHEGQTWLIDFAIWQDKKTGKSEMRVYRIEGNVTTPLLQEALELEAASRGLALMIASELKGG